MKSSYCSNNSESLSSIPNTIHDNDNSSFFNSTDSLPSLANEYKTRTTYNRNNTFHNPLQLHPIHIVEFVVVDINNSSMSDISSLNINNSESYDEDKNQKNIAQVSNYVSHHASPSLPLSSNASIVPNTSVSSLTSNSCSKIHASIISEKKSYHFKLSTTCTHSEVDNNDISNDNDWGFALYNPEDIDVDIPSVLKKLGVNTENKLKEDSSVSYCYPSLQLFEQWNADIPSHNACDATSNLEDQKISGLQSDSIQQRNCLSQHQTSCISYPISQDKIQPGDRCVSSDSTPLPASESVETRESEQAETQSHVKENPTLKVEKHQQNNTILENDPSLLNYITSSEKDDFIVDTLCATNDLVVPHFNTVENMMTEETHICQLSHDNFDVAPNTILPSPSYEVEDSIATATTKKKKRLRHYKRPSYDPPLKIYVVPNDKDVLMGRGGKLMNGLIVSFTLHI